MRSADIRLVIGTRPEAIKLAPVAHALAMRGRSPTLILTGQHPELDLASHDLDPYPVIQFACPGEENPHAHVARVASALEPMLADGPPDLLIVQGDTSSALGGARAAAGAEVPLAHVEAGLRTCDSALPWPEEEYRTEIDAKADLLFAPTDLSALNLACERVAGRVHVTGNTGIDALHATIAELPGPAVHDRAMQRLLVTCHRRESWGEGIRSVASAVRELGSSGAGRIDVIVPPNRHVAGVLREQLEGCPKVSLIEPCSHRELLRRMREADLILSDSGGMQEEAPALGVPLLVLREKTERPEGIATGNMILVGTCRETIVAETRRLLSDPAAYAAMSRPAFPYGDGKAAPRIALIIEKWLNARGMSPRSSSVRRTVESW